MSLYVKVNDLASRSWEHESFMRKSSWTWTCPKVQEWTKGSQLTMDFLAVMDGPNLRPMGQQMNIWLDELGSQLEQQHGLNHVLRGSIYFDIII